MKITLISSHSFSVNGGYEKVVQTLINELIEKYKCQISIVSFTYYKSLLNKDVLKDFRKLVVCRNSDYKSRLHYLVSIVIRRLLNKDLLVNFASIRKCLREFISSDVLLVTDPLLITSVKYLAIENKINARIVYWDHGSLFEHLRGKRKRFVYSREIFKGLKSADAHLCISTEISDFIKKIDHRDNTKIVFNPVPLYEGKLIQKSSIPVFLFVGRLTDYDKNISFMLTGLSKIKNKEWRLKIIGTGKDEDKLRELANKLGILDRIEWLGFRKDPYGEIEYATALLLTSRWEGFPIVLVEANQRGIPVISSDCKSGPKDIIIPGKNGYLYKEGDMNDFVRVISGVIDGKLQFYTPENISKTADRFRDEVVISNIYNSLKRLVEEGD